jgi:hypothetical protein
MNYNQITIDIFGIGQAVKSLFTAYMEAESRMHKA